MFPYMQLSSVADDDSGSFVQVMETFQNIGPILDMSVVDLDKQGQDLVRLHVHMYVCEYIHIFIYIYVCVYIYIYMHNGVP